MAALQYVTVKGYSAIILRRTFPELIQPGGLIPRSKDWIGGAARWKEQTHTWTFRWGSTLAFGHMQTEKDRFDYKGGEYQFVGFDEVTHFTLTQYRYMFTRLRDLVGSEVPQRVRSTANPEGEGLEWVRSRFGILEGGVLGKPFIAAYLDDNPSLDREQYRESLSELDPVTRARLLDGDWSITERGGTFDRSWFGFVNEPPPDIRVVRYWDLAGTDPTKSKKGKDPDWTAGCKVAKTPDGRFVGLHMVVIRKGPADVEALVKGTAEQDGKAVEIVLEQEPGSSGIHLIDHYKRVVLPGYVVSGDRVTGPKHLRWAPVASQAAPISAGGYGNISLLRGSWNDRFLDHMHSLGLPGMHDDIGDAFCGAVNYLWKPSAAAAASGETRRPTPLRANYRRGNRARY